MTKTIRRRLVVCAVVLALVVPAETILLQALSTPDSGDAVQTWVSGLSGDSLDAAVEQIQSYPELYRKELMRVLSPDRRSNVWRGHLQSHLKAHPELDASARQLLEEAIELASPEAFGGGATADLRARTAAVAEQLTAVIGREATLNLLYRLGPRDGTFASLEPMTMRLANYVRGLMVAMAREVSDCNCYSGFGCESGLVCSTNISCTTDEDWPMCGWFWNDPCDGRCLIREVN